MYLDKGQVKIRLTSETYEKHKAEYYLPFDSIIFWYPLYFYYDWTYNYARNKLILKADRKAPRSFTDFVKNNPNYSIDQCVNLETGEGIIPNNRIYKDNIELLYQFKTEMGLTTFDGFFNRQQVTRNFQILEKLLNGIWSNAYQRRALDTGKDEVVNTKELPSSINSREPYDIKVLKYATDQEKSLMIRIGCAEVMSMKMSDALRAKGE